MTEEKALKKTGILKLLKIISLEDAGCALAGLLLELGSSVFSPAPTAAALAAGLSGKGAVCAVIGGIFGALLHGFPTAFQGIIALAVVFAVQFAPDFNNPHIRTAERTTATALAVFATRLAAASSTAELLYVILSALSAGAFTLCLCIFSESSKRRGFDMADARDCAVACILWAMAFMSLGALDYPPLNIGRLAVGIVMLPVCERRGVGTSAAVGVSAVLGLCAASPEIGAGGAIFAFAAVSGMVFSRMGKVVRAAGYVFICVTAALITGIDEGSWRILVEAAASGVVYLIIPSKRAGLAEGDFADASVSYMLRERLNFAADAIAGIGAGLETAADTLERKYNISLSEVPERAADRCCRSCPNSMACWGKDYNLWCKEFERLTDLLRSGKASGAEGLALSPEREAACLNPKGVTQAIDAEYSRYISAKSGERRIREMRRIYTDQLEGVCDILHEMANLNRTVKCASRYQAAERRAEKVLREAGVELPQAFVAFDKRGKLRFEAYGATEPRVTYDYLGTLLSRTLGREMDIPQVSGGGGRYRLTAVEKPRFCAQVGACQIPRGNNRVCGDCYEYFTDSAGVMYVVLSDGMGSGSRARVDSAMACSVFSKLIKCGVSIKTALQIVNTTLMVKSADESFATLDICRIDLNSGEGVLYKAGAAITYIKSQDKLVRAALSSVPAGLGGQLNVPAQKFTVKKGDVVVMMTDGVVPDENWLSRELSQRSAPDEIAERIAKAARVDGTRDDDISVVAMVMED